MEIYLSTATLTSYENRRSSMNLHFNPIVHFKGLWQFPVEYLKDISWEITSKESGVITFEEMEIGVDSPLSIEDGSAFMQFSLKKKGIPFVYDDYSCEIIFKGVLEFPHGRTPFEKVFWGVIKTVWSEGLR